MRPSLAPLLRPRGWAVVACALLACGTPAEPPGDDAATMAGSTSSSSSASTSTSDGASSDPIPSTSSSSTAADDATAESSEGGPQSCFVGSYQCPRGQGCTQPDFLDPPYCTPIPEGGCTQVWPCPEGLMCQQGSHHSEIGECVPIEVGSSSGSSDGSSSGSTGSTSTG